MAIRKQTTPQAPAPPDPEMIRSRRMRAVPDISDRDQKLLGFLDRKYDYYAKARFPFDRQWIANIAYLIGFQYHRWNSSMTQLYAKAVPARRVRLVANLLFATSQQRVAKIVRNRPIVNVIPAETSDEALYKTRACEKFLKAHDQEKRLALQRIERAWWLTVTGNAFGRVYVDSTAGKLLEHARMTTQVQTDPRTGLDSIQQVPEMDDDGFQLIDRTFEGDIGQDVPTPFEFYPDPLGTKMDNIHDYLHVRSVHIDAARLAYPNLADVLKPTRDFSMAGFFQRQIRGLANPRIASVTSSEDSDTEGVVIMHYVSRPSADYPKGREIVKVGDFIGKELDELSYGRFNIVHCGDTPVPGRFWHEATFSQAVPLAKSYNRGKSQVKEIKNTMGVPKWTAPKGHGMGNQAVTTGSGEVIEHNAGLAPTAVAPPPIPRYIMADQESDRQDLLFVMGVSEASRGNNPANVQSGIQFQEIREADETKYGPLLVEFENSEEELGRLTLICAKMVYTEPRMKQILGANSEHELFEFSRDDIPDDYRVQVQAGSSLPVSKYARQDRIMQMHKEGLIVDPQTGLPDPRITLELLEFGDLNRYTEEVQLDEKNAIGENLYVKRGILEGTLDWQRIKVEVFDDDATHIKQHNRFRKNNTYRDLPPEHPLRMFFDQHVSIHIANAAQKAAQMQAQMDLINPQGGDEVQGGGGGGREKPRSTEQRQEGQGGQKGGMAPNPRAGTTQPPQNG